MKQALFLSSSPETGSPESAVWEGLVWSSPESAVWGGLAGVLMSLPVLAQTRGAGQPIMSFT